MNQIKTIKFPKGKGQYELVDENLRNQINNLNIGDSNMATVDWVNDKLSMLALAHRHSIVVQESVRPTCVDGYEIYGCSCGGIATNKIILPAQDDHSYGNPYLSSEFSTGYGQKCNVCGMLKSLTNNTISARTVGSSVFMNVGGVRTEFLVVNQGNPDPTLYDESCDGTWLLMKNIYNSRNFDSTDHDYENSDIHNYLTNTFVNLFDNNIKSVIKQVKVPYGKGAGTNTTVANGSSGLSTMVFLLSRDEVEIATTSNTPVIGSILGYFDGADNSKRIGYLNETATSWLLRSPITSGTTRIYGVSYEGGGLLGYISNSLGVRPALILPSETSVDENNNVLA